MIDTFADLYIKLHINYIPCQSLNLYLAFAIVSLEHPQSSLEFLYISSKYIVSGVTITKIGFYKSIITTPFYIY